MAVSKQPKSTPTAAQTLSCIVAAIQEKKGKQVVSMELDTLPNAVCSHFVVCNADSTTQVDAIAQNIEHRMETDLHERAYRTAGYENALWIVLDYIDVVVHVFQTEQREFYQLESLWADAQTTKYNDPDE
ncbi:MAG: ribosome silencing factor [Bacteroidales bacterium]|nr:ribosome silencing factor [Bacteroidales bacterium]